MVDNIGSVEEEENDSNGAADVDSWVRPMMKKLDPNHCKFSRFFICRVHRDIRKDDVGAYTPKIVSIGPFHRRNKNVRAMEELKRHYLNNILPSDDGNKERRLKQYLQKMKSIEKLVRSYYSEKIDMNQQEFVEMMVVDGCFLIQLLFQEPHEIKHEDPIYNNYWRLPLIGHDMLLLENQLPFVVLEELCPLLGKEKDILWKRALNFYEHLFPKEDNDPKEDSLCKRAWDFCKHLLPKEDNVLKKDIVEREKPQEIYHLLHLIHMYFNPSPPSGQQYPREAPQIRGAAQSTVCGSASISALTMGRRSPTPRGEQSSQEIEYTPSRQQSSREVPLIYASTPIGSAPTHSIPTDCMPPTPQGEQSAQELQHTLSGEQSSLELYIISGEDPLVASGSAPIYSITRPPASQDKQSFSEWSGSSPISRTVGAAPIHPKTKPHGPPGDKQSSQEFQPTQISGQQSILVETCAHPVGASGNTKSKQYPRQPPPKKTIPSATELQEAGLRFQLKKNANNFLDVTFNKQGKLEMPCLGINDSTNSLFRNFIAFEQCFPYLGCHFTSYCFFMDSLVNTAKDVGILSRKDVIENLLGSDKDVALLFNKLCRGVFINFEDSYLREVFKHINGYTQETRHKHRAMLMRDYFSNPWSTISVVAACLIILLTLAQTIFSVLAYFRPPKS